MRVSGEEERGVLCAECGKVKTRNKAEKHNRAEIRNKAIIIRQGVQGGSSADLGAGRVQGQRSKRVNSKTVRWTVFEEGKPCKRGFPCEKHGRSFSQAACGLTDGACELTDNLVSGSVLA